MKELIIEFFLFIGVCVTAGVLGAVALRLMIVVWLAARDASTALRNAMDADVFRWRKDWWRIPVTFVLCLCSQIEAWWRGYQTEILRNR